MPRKFIKRLMPEPSRIKNARSLQILDRWIHDPNLWHLNRRSVATAFFVGLFCAFIPLPLQMLFAAGAAVVFHSNLPISVSLVWITNPITIPPFFYGAYRVGSAILNKPAIELQMDQSWQHIQQELVTVWQPLVLGSLVCGLLCGLLGYAVIHLLWRWHVVQKWQLRRRAKK